MTLVLTVLKRNYWWDYECLWEILPGTLRTVGWLLLWRRHGSQRSSEDCSCCLTLQKAFLGLYSVIDSIFIPLFALYPLSFLASHLYSIPLFSAPLGSLNTETWMPCIYDHCIIHSLFRKKMFLNQVGILFAR